MRPFPGHRQRMVPLVVLAVAGLLRLLVPAGYMPAPLSSGWLVQICPSGLPDSAIQALLGQSQHSHHHHHHQIGNAPDSALSRDGTSSADTGAMAMPQPCELGTGFAGAIAPSTGVVTLPVTTRIATWRRQFASTPDLYLRTAFRSRAPPHRPA